MKRTDINIRDPFVLVHEGAYYLYGTRGATCWGPADGFDVYVSRDLEDWDGPFVCFHNDGSFWADRNYWAPEVYYYQGAFYMFPKSTVADEKVFCEAAKKYHILIVPGSTFACPGYFRLAFCVAKETVLNSLEGFRQLALEFGLTPKN